MLVTTGIKAFPGYKRLRDAELDRLMKENKSLREAIELPGEFF